MGHNPADVTYTERSTPGAVVFTERATPGAVVYTERSKPSTTSLEPLTARQRDDGFWLFLSGIKDGEMFYKNSDDWQLLNGTLAFGAVQRMGQKESDDFVLVLEDSS